MPMKFDAFISYASADKTAADAACAVFEAAGIRCWVAPRDISPGREYAAAIIDAIDQCRVMVLIFSSRANDSPQVRREIERAASKGVAIMPLRIENVVPTKSMEYFLGDIHWLDAMTPPIEEHLQQLAVTIKALLNAGPLRRRHQVREWQAGAVTQGYGANQLPGGVARFDPKYSARRGWLLPTIGEVMSVALLFGGAWLYQIAHQRRCPCPVSLHSRRNRSRSQRKPKRWCRNGCPSFPIVFAQRSEMHICRRTITKRLQLVCCGSVSSPAKRTMTLPRLWRWTIAGRPRTLQGIGIFGAIFTHSAIR